MNRTSKTALLATALILLSACSKYYLQSNLNNLSVGISKAAFLSVFPDTSTTRGPLLRAAKQSSDGLIEVFTMDMLGRQSEGPVPFWFLFKNGSLMQWGRPDDWRNVSATYEIDFNPSPGVRY